MAFWTSRFVQSNGSILKSLKITATALLDELDKPIGVNGKDTTNLTRKVTYRLTILNHPVVHCLYTTTKSSNQAAYFIEVAFVALDSEQLGEMVEDGYHHDFGDNKFPHYLGEKTSKPD